LPSGWTAIDSARSNELLPRAVSTTPCGPNVGSNSPGIDLTAGESARQNIRAKKQFGAEPGKRSDETKKQHTSEPS
jgi:hypothetical protein